MKNRGFVTVATGDKKYYSLAADLLLSYRRRGHGTCKFAIICEEENEYTRLFDDVVTINEVRRSTVDKLLIQYSPYEESIFIDADVLILENIDDLWEVFADQDDFSCFGQILPLDAKEGWFTYEGSGRYKDQIKYLITMNGGIYYLRKSEKSEKVIEKAMELIKDYQDIDFKYFKTPQDEPLAAMAMVLNDCRPCSSTYPMMILPVCKERVRVDYQGNVYEGTKKTSAKFIHFSEPRTRLSLYAYLNEINHRDEGWKSKTHYLELRSRYWTRDAWFDLCHMAGHILRSMKMDGLVRKIKKLIR